MSRGPLVAHLTSVHDAHDVRILGKECRALAEAGYDVVLIAPHDRDETVEGVRIIAVPPPRSRWERLTFTTPAVVRKALRSGARLVHLHDPELLPWGLWLKLRGRRVIYDAHENLPKDIRTKHYLPLALRAGMSMVADALERALCAGLDGVVTVTPGIAVRFPAARTALVRNYPRLDELEGDDASPYASRRSVVLYLGGLSAIRGTREMVRAIGRVDAGMGAELWLAGRFDPPSLEAELASEPGWAHTRRLGWQTRSQVVSLLGQARVGLLVLHPAPNHLDSLPIKLFEYMAAGLPVVASDFPAWREIVGEGAMYVDPMDPDAIARAVQWLLTHPSEAAAMGAAGRAAVRETLHWDREAATLKQLYARVVGPPRGGG